MLTLRQIEVIRAVMVTGTLASAARLLNVAAPGLSRLMKYTEESLGTKLFVRHGGRFVPAPEARAMFAQINEVHRNIENLRVAVDALARGEGAELKIGATPSIGHVIGTLTIAKVRRRYADLLIDFDILKIEDAIDYLLLGRGEVVAISYRLEHPAINFEPLAMGKLVCIVAGFAPARLAEPDLRCGDRHLSADRNRAARSVRTSIVVRLFERAGVAYRVPIKARFGVTVCALGSARKSLGLR